MITKTTGLSSSYDSLFEEINKAGKDYNINISSLEDYFGNVQEIANLPEGEKYLRMPLDEPMFEIDANSRKIDTSKFTGVQVQGDHAAETIFFSIDRYFDYMDLNNVDIYINWKMGSESGHSINFIKSGDIIPGKLVFGWPIAKEFTGKSGALSFGVEFFREIDGETKYSLNTLISTLNIKDGLVLTDPMVVDISSDIKSNLINSSFGEGEAAVDTAVWVSGNGNGLVFENLGSSFAAIIDLATALNESGEPQSISAKFVAEAFAGQEADIFYSVDGETSASTEYVEVTEIPEVIDRKYFKDVDGEKVKAIESDIEAWRADQADEEKEDKLVLYEKVAFIEVGSNGIYTISAQGVKYDSNDVKIGASDRITSASVTIPAAQAPASIVISGPAPAIEGETAYTFEENLSNVAFLIDDEPIELAATAVFESGIGAVDLDWFKDAGEEAVDSTGFVVDDNEDNKFIGNYSVTEPGVYTVKVKHFKNSSINEEAVSAEFLVSNLASEISAISFLTSQLADGTYSVINNTISRRANKPFFVRVSTPDFEMQDGEKLFVSLIKGSYVEDGEGNLVLSDEWEAAMEEMEYTTDHISIPVTIADGVYKVVVSTKYNGSIYSISSDAFTISTTA